ncbi:MAG: hypothetical protein A3F68_02720 [Acidobacteria bacterium RIFCSPLOWO2_12_FULL_54_10]|nr:MAG: hypothetical protein A3F68_02720 [Acidobacteria bacterium RIFCSPLOWO2_12_FULL_54_10]
MIPDKPLPDVKGDIFIGSAAMGSAMHGDRVQVSDIRVRNDGRAEGRIQKVLDRAHETVVGEFHSSADFDYVVAYDERISHRILITEQEEERRGKSARRRARQQSAGQRRELDGKVVNVEMIRFPTTTQRATGRIIEVLGDPDDFRVDVEVVIRKNHLPHVFPANALAEAQQKPVSVGTKEIHGRRDFRNLPIVTIDGETAKDFDDAVAVFPMANGNFQLQVHIADVAHYVQPGSAIDREARLRGTSVYFPDRAIPMLPPELSSGICSLKPREDRLVLSVLMEIDHRGELLHAEFCEGVIRSTERMTYTAVNAVLENDAEARGQYAGLATEFERMRDLALIMNKKRQRLGSIDFDLPEAVIEFDEFGAMKAIVRSERNIAHRLIEEFMLAANEAVASYLEGLGVASLYRIHEIPDPAKVMEFEELAAAFGYSLGLGPLPVKRFATDRTKQGKRTKALELPAGEIPVTARHYQKLTEKIAGKPEERIVSYLMLRSLRQAIYSEANEGHFALAMPCYTHFTSPIRRYPDLIVHRILRATMEAVRNSQPNAEIVLRFNDNGKQRTGSASLADPISSTELREIASESSEAERRAASTERELMEWKKSRFMRDKLGDEFDALVIGTNKAGFFVELEELFIEGFVPIETMTDQMYRYRELDKQWVGEKNRRRFGLGDRIRARLDRVGRPGERMTFSVCD